MSDDLSQVAKCNVIARKAMHKLGRFNYILGRFIPDSFSKLISALIRPRPKVNIQICLSILKRDKIDLEVH